MCQNSQWSGTSVIIRNSSCSRIYQWFHGNFLRSGTYTFSVLFSLTYSYPARILSVVLCIIIFISKGARRPYLLSRKTIVIGLSVCMCMWCVCVCVRVSVNLSTLQTFSGSNLRIFFKAYISETWNNSEIWHARNFLKKSSFWSSGAQFWSNIMQVCISRNALRIFFKLYCFIGLNKSTEINQNITGKYMT